MSRTTIQKGKMSVPVKTPDKARLVLPGGRFWRISIWSVFYICFFLFMVFYLNPPVFFSSAGVNIHEYVDSMHRQDALKDSTVQYVDPWIQHLYIPEYTKDYFHKVIAVPGGLSTLAVTMCIYACHNSVIGAAVLTLLAIIVNVLMSVFIKGLCGRRSFFAGYIPALFIMTICVFYEPAYLRFLMPLAGALVFAIIYQRLTLKTVAVRVIAMTLLFWLAWFALQWGCVFALLFMVMIDFFRKERIRIPVIAAAVVNALVFLIDDAFIVPFSISVPWIDLMAMNGLVLVAMLTVPAVIVYSALLSVIIKKYSNDTKKKIRLFEAAVFTLCTVVIVAWLYADPVNRNTRTIARTVYHVNNGMWDGVLDENTKTLYKDFPNKAGALQLFMVHATNNALLHKGLIGDKLLRYPQAAFSYDPLLMLESTMRSGFSNWIVVMNLAMKLGLVNTAEKVAGELMEKMGPYPEILYKRGLIQIAKGNNEVASVYLGRLSHIPLYRQKALQLLHNISTRSVTDSEPIIASMRANKDTVDYFLLNYESVDNVLKYLLQSNLGNKAAYDYLMTHYLLTGQLDNITEIAPAASSFGYTHLPRCWEEAVCLNQAMNMMKESSAQASFTGISQETVDRFSAFTKEYLPLEHDPQAKQKLQIAYGDTYYYFFIFRHSSGVYHE